MKSFIFESTPPCHCSYTSEFTLFFIITVFSNCWGPRKYSSNIYMKNYTVEEDEEKNVQTKWMNVTRSIGLHVQILFEGRVSNLSHWTGCQIFCLVSACPHVSATPLAHIWGNVGWKMEERDVNTQQFATFE